MTFDSDSPGPEERKRVAFEAVGATGAVTAAAALAMHICPSGWRGTAVGAIFLGATYLLVWRHDDMTVARAGLGLGGIVASDPTDEAAPSRFGGSARAFAWALAAMVCTFVPFYFGWRYVWHPPRAFVLPTWTWIGRVAAGQLIGVALPEEAFYRGYLQTKLTFAFGPARRILGVRGLLAILVTSVLFALGHVATIPYLARLAVFFPSLVFGWLRARTGGIGAPMIFHAACNTLSETLGAGFGIY